MIYIKGCRKEARHEKVGTMTPFIQSSRTNYSMVKEIKYLSLGWGWLSGTWRNFLGDGNVLYLDSVGSYSALLICQAHLIEHLRFLHFFWRQMLPKSDL